MFKLTLLMTLFFASFELVSQSALEDRSENTVSVFGPLAALYGYFKPKPSNLSYYLISQVSTQQGRPRLDGTNNMKTVFHKNVARLAPSKSVRVMYALWYGLCGTLVDKALSMCAVTDLGGKDIS